MTEESFLVGIQTFIIVISIGSGARYIAIMSRRTWNNNSANVLLRKGIPGSLINRKAPLICLCSLHFCINVKIPIGKEITLEITQINCYRAGSFFASSVFACMTLSPINHSTMKERKNIRARQCLNRKGKSK